MPSAQEIQDAYAELDLKPGASLEEVKASYHRLARALHPDLHPGTLGCLMTRVNQAYRVLLLHFAAQISQPKPAPAYRFQEFAAPPKPRARTARNKWTWRELWTRAAQAAVAGLRPRTAPVSAPVVATSRVGDGPLAGPETPAPPALKEPPCPGRSPGRARSPRSRPRPVGAWWAWSTTGASCSIKWRSAAVPRLFSCPCAVCAPAPSARAKGIWPRIRDGAAARPVEAGAASSGPTGWRSPCLLIGAPASPCPCRPPIPNTPSR